MRLNPNDISAIKAVIVQAMGNDSRIWLFGSRVDDSKRGGDIDLYVESAQPCNLNDKIHLITNIQRAIGLRKIDLLVNSPGTEHKAIYDTAKKEGKRL